MIMSAGEVDVIAISELKENNESTDEHNAKNEEKSVDASSGNIDMDQSKEENKCSDVSEAVTDPHVCLGKRKFSSETYNVCVKNIPKRVSYKEFTRRMAKTLGFEPQNASYSSHNSFAFLQLNNEGEREKAISILDGYLWKTRNLKCMKAHCDKDPFAKKSKKKQQFHEDQCKKQTMADDDDPEDKIVEFMCPYASKTYEEQLLLKEGDIRSCFEKLIFRLTGAENAKSLKCTPVNVGVINLELLSIIRSPILNNYKNKVEFDIGQGKDITSDNVVGYRLRVKNELGRCIMAKPTKCINISSKVIQVAEEFQKFIQGLPYPSYVSRFEIGFWQRLSVQTCNTGDIRVIIQVFPSRLSTEEYDDVQKQVTEFFTSSNRTVKVSSLYMSSCSPQNSDIAFKHLTGELNIKGEILGLQFRISPGSFFSNTAAAETLYKTICDWCHTEEDDTHILDIFCGVGTMGICIANGTSHHLTGIEVSQQAIEDAKFNAKYNGIQNANFICGKAEDVITNTLKNIRSNNIIAVIDSPKSGLCRDAAEKLRACTAIKRIIYVSSHPSQACDNFLWFCRPKSKKFKGEPFKNVRAQPVDLFPHMKYSALIVELRRI